MVNSTHGIYCKFQSGLYLLTVYSLFNIFLWLINWPCQDNVWCLRFRCGTVIVRPSHALAWEGMLWQSFQLRPGNWLPRMAASQATYAGIFFYQGGVLALSMFQLSKYNFIYFMHLLWAALGLPCWGGLSLVAANRGHSPVAVGGLLLAVASLVEEHGLH